MTNILIFVIATSQEWDAGRYWNGNFWHHIRGMSWHLDFRGCDMNYVFWVYHSSGMISQGSYFLRRVSVQMAKLFTKTVSETKQSMVENFQFSSQVYTHRCWGCRFRRIYWLWWAKSLGPIVEIGNITDKYFAWSRKLTSMDWSVPLDSKILKYSVTSSLKATTCLTWFISSFLYEKLDQHLQCIGCP